MSWSFLSTPHTENIRLYRLLKACRDWGKLMLNEGTSHIMLSYHFQFHEWLMPNNHCWQSVLRLQLCAILLHDLKGLNIVQTPFKKHKDVSGWKIRPFANALRTKNLDTYAWSLHIFTDLFKIHIAFMGLTLFSKTRKNASVFKIFRILSRIWRITIYFSPRLITKHKLSWD